MSRGRPLRRALSVIAAALVVAGVAGVAQAKITNLVIVPGKSIGPVSVGMTRGQVEQVLGRGIVIGHTGVRVEEWPKLKLAAFFKGSSQSAATFGLEALGIPWYMQRHITYGSATKTVEAAYPGMHCVASDAPGPDNPFKECTLHGPTGRLTIFYFDTAGDVTRIAVGASSLASTP